MRKVTARIEKSTKISTFAKQRGAYFIGTLTLLFKEVPRRRRWAPESLLSGDEQWQWLQGRIAKSEARQLFVDLQAALPSQTFEEIRSLFTPLGGLQDKDWETIFANVAARQGKTRRMLEVLRRGSGIANHRDMFREFGYTGIVGSLNSRFKRLNLPYHIRCLPDPGFYQIEKWPVTPK